jgi:O-antigen ligase
MLDVHVDWLWLVFPPSLLVYLSGMGDAYGGVGRFRSIFSNANALGAWGSLCLPLLFGLALTHPVAWRRKACVALFLMGGLCVYLSGSRGGVVGAALGILVYAVMRWPRRTLSGMALVSVVMAFLLAYDVDFKPVTSRMQHLIRPESLGTLSERKVSWEMGLMIARQRPLLGHGFGLSDKAFVWYEVENPGSFYSLHNTYLDAYVGIGQVGVALIVLILLLTYWTGLRTYLRDRDGPRGLLALALLCSVIGTTAHGAVENFFLSMGNPWSLPLWVGVAMTAKLAVLQRASERSRETETDSDDGVVVPFPDAAEAVTP